MTAAQTTLIIQLGVGAVVSMFVAWLAATFAAKTTLKRFYKERIWERKATAYTTILEALYLWLDFYGTHFEAAIERRNLKDERIAELIKQKAEARSAMMRSIEGLTWLFGSEVNDAIAKMDHALRQQKSSFEEEMDDAWGAVREAKVTITALARKDLAIAEVGPWSFLTKLKRPRGKK
ncbi:MAG: hypothetical protein KKG69_05700 [Alphaproteobacteria bacterium]|uniref:hypothetical protein n=1 Tax=Brevundimonas sp. TaxID=1871086 RepID=UPI003567172F|nr:hypothetical protein [Alphaproteobacteria bacterium]MBU2163535.1 hypothetical protein [Alphaproteobacteria bacterium]MBU2230753.1 hypothetical protein [Alphaproteobacteria bacterium]